MSIDDWIEEKKQEYIFDIKVVEHKTDFNKYEYIITDPRQTALDFTILANEAKDATAFMTETFKFGWFNIAEGYSSENILEAASHCLDGSLELTQTLLGRPRLKFESVEGKAEKNAKLSQAILSGYMRGYEKI